MPSVSFGSLSRLRMMHSVSAVTPLPDNLVTNSVTRPAVVGGNPGRQHAQFTKPIALTLCWCRGRKRVSEQVWSLMNERAGEGDGG